MKKLFAILGLLFAASLAVAQSGTTISYTFQYPPRSASLGGCVNIATENGVGVTGDAMCLQTSAFNDGAGFSVYFNQSTDQPITLEAGTLTYNGRVWNYNAAPVAPCRGPGPGSTFTDSYSNSFGDVSQGWSGSLLINGQVTSTKVGSRSGCTYQLVHTTGSGTEVFNPPVE